LEPYSSDGTAAGTHLVRNINRGGGDGGDSSPVQFTDVDGTLFFSAIDWRHGRELWTTDGTRAGTTLVRDIYSGKATSYPSGLRSIGGRLFFDARDGTHGAEPWKATP
jgi:ELWxxDGT repeat protein